MGWYLPARSLEMASSMEPTRVEVAHSIAVAAIGPLGGDLAVGGVARRVDLGRHQSLGEGAHHLAQQVRAVLVEVLAQPLERVHVVGDFHRVSSQLVFARDLLKLMRWSSLRGWSRTPWSFAGPTPGVFPFSASERTTAGQIRTPPAGTQTLSLVER
jgi:hypothetical protein